jgi:hypothetical protein
MGKLLLCMALLFGVSCHDEKNNIESGSQQPTVRKDVRSEIKSTWEQSCKALNEQQPGREIAGKKLDLLINLLKQRSPEEVNAERERVKSEPVDYDHMDQYDSYLLQALFVISANAKDRQQLVSLLSAKGPRFVANSAIELEVASLEIDKPLLILFDSYDKATDGQRSWLVNVLRHGFKDLSKQFSDDEQFISASKTWYLANEPRIKPNPYYHPFVEFPEQRPLFVPQS